MLDAGRRPMGRLFYWALVVAIAASGCWIRALGAAPQSGPATTTVADTVYMADGTVAQGTLIITWPAFVTSGGAAIAAGETNVTLGANGALNVALVPNAGATPAGMYYTVVYQLGPGEVRTESWVVPTTSPANLATVRTTPGSGMAQQAVSMQYVNSELATKADDSAVVHLSGAETITGAKTFSSSPTVPAPTAAGNIANKSYVDQSVANVGAGNYLSTAGGTMTGPILLPGNPAAPLQAAPKQYVDAGMSGKADLVGGTVPSSELGTGTASAGSCLLGNGSSSMWGACGGGSGTGNVSTAPVASQNVAQPEGTQFSANNLANVRYVTPSWSWQQSPADVLTTAGSNTIHLTPCPLGIDTSNNTRRPYYVYVAGTGTAETSLVTGGTCTGGAASGTIVVTTGSSHAAGYTVGSSTSGIQEALNDAGTPGAGVVIPPTGNTNALPVYATIYVQSNKSSLRGEGKATLLCKTRSACVFLGDRTNVNDFEGIEVSGLRFAAGLQFDGMQITNTACSAGSSTITLNNTGANAVQAGDWVDINWTFNPHYFGLHQVASASATQFTYADTNCGGAGTIASQASAGFASLEYAAIEDNAIGSSLHDIFMSDKDSVSTWGFWQNHIVVDNDQAFKLDTLGMDEGPNCTANYCGQSIYFPGPFSLNASVAWLSHLNVSLQCGGNGITAWNGNTIHISNSVIQAFAQWGVYDGTLRGGYGGGEFDDVYEEVGGCTNPMYPGSGAQKQGMAGLLNSGSGNTIRGGEFPIGQLPQFAASGNEGARYNYCFVVHDTSEGTSKCLTAGYALVDSASPAGNIVVSWPRVQGTGTVSYDLLRFSGTGNSAIAPYTGGCGGGSTTACGSVAVAVAQCGTNFCSYTDTASAPTNSYAVTAPNYVPGIFWLPGGIVTLNPGDAQNFGTAPTFVDDTGMVTGLSPITTEAGSMVPEIFAQRCNNSNGNEWISCLAGNSNGNNSMPNAMLLQYGVAAGGPQANLKGRLNFTSSQSGSVNNGEIVTLVDSNPAKTLATPGNRPSADAADTYLGLDVGSVPYAQAGLAVGAPYSISSYIDSTPNGTNFLERLTAGAKIFNVPVTINGNLVVTGTCSGCGSGSGGSMTWPATGGIAVYGGSGAWGTSLAAPSSGVVGVSDTQTLTNKTVDGVAPATMAFVDATSSIQTQLNGKAPNASPTFTGTVTLPVTGTGSQCLHVSATGAVSGTGSDCGSGGAGSGTVNSGASSQVAMYSASGAAVSGDSELTDNGTTLNYSGSGGISAGSGTFSGSLTVNGQLMVAGPWTVSSPIPGTAMAAAGAGTSALGISNDGYFYISANGASPQKVATTATSSYFSNLFQEDANDEGMYNPLAPTTAQNLHVYSSYTNSSTWQRTTLGFDSGDNYAVVKSENSAAGQAPGLGFWVNSGLKWVIDSGSTLKPWSDMAYNIGSFTASSGLGLRPATIYAAGSVTSNSGFELGRYANNSYELCNDATNGTVINGLAVLTAGGCAMRPSAAASAGIIGVVIANAGTSGTTTLARTGSAYCNFDATPTVVGDYVVASSTANGGAYPLCHDAGAAMPSGVQVLGRVLQATPGGQTAQMFFDMPGTSLNPILNGTCYVDGFVHINLASCVNALTANGQASGIIYDNLPEEITSNPFPSSFAGKLYLGPDVGGAASTCGTGNVNCWVWDVPAVIPAGLDVQGVGGVIAGNSWSTGTAFTFGSTFMTALGSPAQPTLACSATGGTLSNGTYYVQVAWVNNLETNAGASAVPGYSSPSTEKSVTCSNGTSTQSITVSSPGAAGGTNALAATDFAIYSASGAGLEESGCSQVTQSCTGQNVTCGANGVGTSDVVACKLGSTATVTAIASTANGGNPPPLIDTSNPLVVIARGSRATNISFGDDLRDISINGSNTGGNTSVTNEPSVGVLNLQGEEQSGLNGVLVTGPWLNAGLYSETDAVNYHITNSQINGGSSTTTTYIPAIFDNRVSGNVKVQGGTPHGIFDTTITCRTAGASCPYVVYVTGPNANAVFLGDHIETNASTGDCIYTTNSATAMVYGGANYCSKSVVHNAASGRRAAVTEVDDSFTTPTYGIVEDDAITAGTGNCNSGNSYCSPNHSSYDSLLYAGSLNALNAAVSGTMTEPDGTTNNSTGYTFAHALTLPSGSVATTQSAADSSTKVATDAFAHSVVPADTSATVWITVPHSSSAGTVFSSSASKAAFFGVMLGYQKTTSQVSYYVNTADSSATTYDLGIYSGTSGGTCTLMAHTGSIAGSTAMTTGAHTVSWTGGAVTLQPGRYYLALTASAASSPAMLYGDSAGVTFAGGTGTSNVGNVSIASGGTLPASATCPTDSVQVAALIPAWLVD